MISRRTALPPTGVSLFTREWIEINSAARFSGISNVSLFTREWIEIWRGGVARLIAPSPSLRGSGLKLQIIL